MGFAVASNGAPLAGFLKKLLLAAPPAPAALALRPASVAAARRLFNTGGARFRRDDDDYEESSGDEELFCDRRRCRRARDFSAPTFFSADVGEPVRLGRLLALMEDDAAAPRRGWWVSKEDGDAVQLKVPMPGLGKEHVKVWADQGGLVIAGEDTGDDEEEGPARYGGYIELPSDAFKMDQIKAEMKDGVLRVTVPKIKVEDRKDVFQVKVE
ncbi:26.2 kDa heat shock protein, mitochondrial-like [Panicum miliaceum]|uniref:26.2 kDa heat shock protein, mitochondrial-like n=1 Tax=Panicum miliaceum TaxID=4540 RepID=A0A3L6S0A8_PANMI|nr:26.2 kDa heat shock protein, mitochondrial-like [Panicum miliaceum]